MLIYHTVSLSFSQLSKENLASRGKLWHSCAYDQGKNSHQNIYKFKALSWQVLGLPLIKLRAAKLGYTLCNFKQFYESYNLKVAYRDKGDQ